MENRSLFKRWRLGRWRWIRYVSAFAGLMCPGTVAILTPAALPAAPADDPIIPVSVAAVPAPDRVRLGEFLFNDTRLSGGNDISCASCHDLDRGGDDGIARARGADGGLLDFNTPTVFNAGLSSRLNWRGNFRSLEDLIEAVLLDTRLMNSTWDKVLAGLRADPDYRRAFAEAYGSEPGPAQVLDALAVFGRSLLTPDAPFDRYLRGDKDALTAEQEDGYRLFKNYGCTACHQGVNIGGNLFQRFGIFEDPPPGRPVEADLGRFTLTGRPDDRHVFRVPSLRNVAVTAPYFHDGRTATLDKAVEAMARSQLGRTLEKSETDRIVSFLDTLTGLYRGRSLEAAGP
jgi:cytochrome c peroxidase